jgi:hypothetical protein
MGSQEFILFLPFVLLSLGCYFLFAELVIDASRSLSLINGLAGQLAA